MLNNPVISVGNITELDGNSRTSGQLPGAGFRGEDGLTGRKTRTFDTATELWAAPGKSTVAPGLSR